MPMFNPSRACTVSNSFAFLPPSVAAVRYTCSRVSYSATLSTNGVTRCTPGYSVPGRTPQNWLTRTPAVPSGTTTIDRKSTRLNSSHQIISYAVFCLKKKKKTIKKKKNMQIKIKPEHESYSIECRRVHEESR